MKLIKKAWNVYWVVDRCGNMVEAAIGGPRSGYSGEHGREYGSLSELKACYNIKTKFRKLFKF